MATPAWFCVKSGEKTSYVFFKGVAMQKKFHKIAEKTDSRKIAEFLSKDGVPAENTVLVCSQGFTYNRRPLKNYHK